MGVLTAFMTLLVPFTVLAVLPPSPIYPGVGPLPGAPPVIIPVDDKDCIAMRREVQRVPVPVPYFCHPRDAKGIPFPEIIDKEVTFMIMRLQWSGYKVCTRQMHMATHRYIPVPVCCPGWQRGPTGKCDAPTFKPSPVVGPCLNGGILKPNGKCCFCPPGFSGPLCQHTARPFDSMRGYPQQSKPGSPSILPPPMRIPASGNQPKRPMPITPGVVKVLSDAKSHMFTINDPKRPPLPVNIAYINQMPPVPSMSSKPVASRMNPPLPINPAYVNQMPPMNKLQPNPGYINQMPPRRVAPKTPSNPAYINRLVSQSVNPAYVNQVFGAGPLRMNPGSLKGVPSLDPRQNMPPQQPKFVNRLIPGIQLNKVPPMMSGIPPNSPRPVMAPPVAVVPTLGLNPSGNQPPMEPRPINQGPLSRPPQQGPSGVRPPMAPMMPGQGRPMARRPNLANEDQCQKILEVGVTRCFRDAGITAAPRDVFNPQNPDVARSICSQGGRLRPCIMAGETACGSGMRVIITRRMLATLLNAMGNLCAPRPMMMPVPMPKRCINGGTPIMRNGKHMCQCHRGFAGEICEIAVCPLTCENEGLCENDDGTPKCVCPTGFFGDRCEQSVPVTTVTDPKPVDPPTHSLETSPNPVPSPEKTTDSGEAEPEQTKQQHAAVTKKKVESEKKAAKMEIWGYPLWFILAIILGFFVFMLVIFVTCCLCLRCRRAKKSFEVQKEAVKMPVPVLDNVYTVGVIPPIYESKGIPPLSYEEAKGETIKAASKQDKVELANNEE